MLSYDELRVIGLKARESYLNPPTDRCYEVCCDLAELLVTEEGVSEQDIRVMSLYIKDTSIKHFVVELSESCIPEDQFVLIDPTIDQFCSDEKDVDNIPISLGEDLPKVGIYTSDNHPY